MLYDVAIREAQIAREIEKASDYGEGVIYYDREITWLNSRRRRSLRLTDEDFIRGECLIMIAEARQIATSIYLADYDDPYLHDSTYELLEYLDKIEGNFREGQRNEKAIC